ncbi:MAG TPA: cell division regulator GpsB [Firmicutes bacterium]|jgi:cell cycle protein gpsB|nr:cell cycle protein GpsB [Coprobacillus sp. CAG:605]HCY44621.1 cell division regulator GpsB [Bacillota bacterium]
MVNDRIILTPQDILEKEFKVDARGYRAQEVDKFLDMIIKDYTEYNKMIKSLNREINTLTEENNRLRSELRKLKELESVAESDSRRSVNNVDLLKRISQLEKIVYGKSE